MEFHGAIKVNSIQFKLQSEVMLASDDLVHVDILDVAERGREDIGEFKHFRVNYLRISTADPEVQEVNAVILMVDPSKPFTFDFAKRSMDHVAEHIDVLILVTTSLSFFSILYIFCHLCC